MSPPAADKPDSGAPDALADFLRERFPAGDEHVVVVAGSGLGGFVRSLAPVAECPFAELPGVGGSTVQIGRAHV